MTNDDLYKTSWRWRNAEDPEERVGLIAAMLHKPEGLEIDCGVLVPAASGARRYRVMDGDRWVGGIEEIEPWMEPGIKVFRITPELPF